MHPLGGVSVNTFILLALTFGTGSQAASVLQANGLGDIINNVGRVGSSLLGSAHGGAGNLLGQASNLVSNPLGGILGGLKSHSTTPDIGLNNLALPANFVNGLTTGAQAVFNQALDSATAGSSSVPAAGVANTASYGGYGALSNLAAQASHMPALATTSSMLNNQIHKEVAINKMAAATQLGPASLPERAARAAAATGAAMNNVNILNQAHLQPIVAGLGAAASDSAAINAVSQSSALASGALRAQQANLEGALAASRAVGSANALLAGSSSLGAAESIGAAANRVAAGNTLGALSQTAVGNTLGAIGQAAAVGNTLGAMGQAAAIGNTIEASNQVAAVNALTAPINTVGIAEVIGAPSPSDNALYNDAALVGNLKNRQALASSAYLNAQSEAALAGADMVAHGANNARSASIASNAYRQAKLAGARDRVNIAGTIQNSARISDAAIATHDAATKAEDSLIGSELAVDSAATVLDSDAAYIPPVTNSLLRSLPYGRLGLRNILPKPLTYPSVLLPDVWLNGAPVNYLSVPFRHLPYGIGPAGYGNVAPIGPALNAGQFVHGQQLYSNNGLLLNSYVFDPATAWASGLQGIVDSSILPVLANGQLQAQDEIAMANVVTRNQQLGAGMLGTYTGFGAYNTVPMLTGTVSDVNLAPTTTIGTTYPIGSALVIEPRDSYFQDYIDNASSRQNFDEHQQ